MIRLTDRTMILQEVKTHCLITMRYSVAPLAREHSNRYPSGYASYYFREDTVFVDNLLSLAFGLGEAFGPSRITEERGNITSRR